MDGWNVRVGECSESASSVKQIRPKTQSRSVVTPISQTNHPVHDCFKRLWFLASGLENMRLAVGVELIKFLAQSALCPRFWQACCLRDFLSSFKIHACSARLSSRMRSCFFPWFGKTTADHCEWQPPQGRRDRGHASPFTGQRAKATP